MYSVYQHWDPLKVCVVGSTWPPEFYSWIQQSRVRHLFEIIAKETQEDLDNLAATLQTLGVEVLRPKLSSTFTNPSGKYLKPPQTPRDYLGMIGTRLYNNYGHFPAWNDSEYDLLQYYQEHKDSQWPDITAESQIAALPGLIRTKIELGWQTFRGRASQLECFAHIMQQVQAQGNPVVSGLDRRFNTAMIYRIGKDLFHGTMENIHKRQSARTRWQAVIDKHFPGYRNHIIDTQGHSDGVYCPVRPGLLFALDNMPTLENFFPGWEIVWLPSQVHLPKPEFQQLKQRNQGKWWIPGWEHDAAVIAIVDKLLQHWTGNVAETVFDVNMLVVDHKNVIVTSYNQQVFEVLARYGINAQVCPLRHKYFWDGGIHCVTTDLHRQGEMRDYFPHLA